MGHNSLTYNYTEKVATAVEFFSDQMTVNEARTFLSQNNIGYVALRKKDTQDPTNFMKTYPFLTPWFENTGIIIYAIKP